MITLFKILCGSALSLVFIFDLGAYFPHASIFAVYGLILALRQLLFSRWNGVSYRAQSALLLNLGSLALDLLCAGFALRGFH
jgi:hypothetical protein